MPLEHSKSAPAFKRNVKALMGEVGTSPHVKSRDQALAIAYDIKRRGRAFGGLAPTPWETKAEARGMMHTGPILSAVPGRTDNHHMTVPGGSYVVNADTVSHLGQNNTNAGLAVLNRMFGKGSPYGGTDMPVGHGPGAPKPPRAMGFADAGGARGTHTVGKPVEVMTAGGEYVIPPEVVARIGHGDISHGHQILDAWMQQMRKDHIKTLQKLPGPAKN